MPWRPSIATAARAFASVMFAGVMLAGVPAMGAADDTGHRFTIHNDSPAQIIAWRVAAAGSRQWGPNLIAGAPVAPGEVRTITFGRPSDPCVVDVLVVPRPGEPSIAPAQNDCDPNFNGVASFTPSPPAAPAAPTDPAPKGAP